MSPAVPKANPEALLREGASMPPTRLRMSGVAKHFTLHHQHGLELAVFDSIDLTVAGGECVVLDGASGLVTRIGHA